MSAKGRSQGRVGLGGAGTGLQAESSLMREPVGLVQPNFWSPPLQSLFLGISPVLEVRLLSQLILPSQSLLLTLPIFPQAPGEGSLEVLF